LTKALLRDWAIKSYFIFSLHLNSVSALPGKTQMTENASFQLNTACYSVRKHTKHIYVITKSHSN